MYYKNAKIGKLHSKIFFRTIEPKKLRLHERFLIYLTSSLFKSWSLGVGWGHNKENHSTCVYIEKRSFSEPAAQFQSN
jgi:hypothetical protein